MSDTQEPIINNLASVFLRESENIKSWFDEKYKNISPLVTTSVDIRNSGFKIAPVDTNIFPAGFNNLGINSKTSSVKEFKKFVDSTGLVNPKVAIIAENHSRNQKYWDNIKSLKEIIILAGFTTKAGVIKSDLEMPEEISGQKINLFYKKSNKLIIVDYEPDIIILNRDFSSDNELEVFNNLKQKVFPSPNLGWHNRTKSNHFDIYQGLAKDFSEQFDIDRWLISAYHTSCGDLDFKDKINLDCIANNVEKTIFKIKNKYQEYNIKEDPYVFVKSDMGTYGMGIMVVKSGEEVLSINKKVRNKMSKIKEGVKNTQVIIQEGVPTIDSINGNTAEPFMYLINGEVIGGIYRVNNKRDRYGNLNSEGMEFSSMDCEEINSKQCCPTLKTIAKIASLAAASELKTDNT